MIFMQKVSFSKAIMLVLLLCTEMVLVTHYYVEYVNYVHVHVNSLSAIRPVHDHFCIAVAIAWKGYVALSDPNTVAIAQCEHLH